MKKFLCLFLGVLLLSSCGVQYKQVPYFKDLAAEAEVSEVINNKNILKVQTSDVLGLTVSSLNPEASAIFNLGNTTSIPTSSQVGNIDPIITSNGFLVDEDGNIQLPLVGSIHVKGLTISEARKVIQDSLTKFLKEPTVSLRLVNFRVSILGDVLRPGVYPINNERITVAEALSFAGDLNITALRNNVLLVREQSGNRIYVRLDLGKKEFFNSPYYYLQNNDVLYIQPSNAKYASVDSSYRNVSIILSALSVIALLITNL